MIIPTRLSSLLQTNDKLNGAVLQTISIVRPWFEDNKLVFFPEYTDHGPKHVHEVFETAESLITETSWPLLRSEDVATLILGIILHDCAMHVSEDGFISLISDGSRPLKEGFAEKSWSQLWDEFMAEARRFDERKLKALFDDVEPVRTPSLDPLTMSKRDRLLIGEFLRRHHPRLAHEIALLGVPGPASKGLSLGDVPPEIRELAGLVARSHGLDLRVCVDYLNHKSKWGARRTRGVHVTYLMVLVRIADYLQIHSSRAPQEVLQVRSLRSPVSRGEWDAHAAIADIHQETDDPEALWVESQPENVQTYLKLKHLLSDIQREIDDCWAVLGEVYGPKEDLRGFGIRIRRVKSNLQDPSFANTVSYVPCQAALHTAGVDLLKLLITPLYGDRPEVGIRELLQNAVDACRELQDHLSKNPQLSGIDLPEQDGDVVIELHEKEDQTFWITVSDRGIGMAVDTILNYFLKAGASFRNSFAWRKQHEDEHGETRVLRSGRFGIGVLAGFLLGREIQVTTRHVTAPPHEGLTFTCRLEDEQIQIDRISRPVGTTVSIQISNSTYDSLLDNAEVEVSSGGYEVSDLHWDWYCLAEPLVRRIIPTGPILQRYVLPEADSTLPEGWKRTTHSEYKDIHWSYIENTRALTCNGIAIKSLTPVDNYARHFQGGYYERYFDADGLVCPKLSIFDPDGNLPLNLQRTALSVDQLPFQDELINDICLDILAYLLVHTPKRKPSYVTSTMLYNSARISKSHPGIAHTFSHYYADKGLALLAPWHVQELKTKTIFAFTNHLLPEALGIKSFQPHVPYAREDEVLYAIGKGFGWLTMHNYRLIGTDRFIQEVKDHLRNFYGHQRQLSAPEKWRNRNWRSVTVGMCPDLTLDLDRIPSELDRNQLDFLLIFYPSSKNTEAQAPLTEAWREIIGLPYIAYDIKTRKKQLAGAYKRLASYIEQWEAKRES